MIANSLSEICKSIAPALGNHLWQSTLFAIAAGLLTLSLRNNHARTRYLLWLTASVKFLIPFSLLAGMGSHIAWWRGPAGASRGVYIAMDQLSQPFSPSRISLPAEATPAVHSAGLIELLPVLLAAVWLCGIAVVVLAWYVRWRRVTAAIRGALPVKSGRELETLRRVERSGGVAGPIELIFSESALEPGIFGINHPVLLLPAGISDRLTGAQLEAIITHELCHVRRRDNLAAVLHMSVEAVFWFHPLVWWIGARLTDERERACDEEVLSLGNDAQVYAEGILKVCKFYMESPLLCAAGVTGSNLKKRIEAIMMHRAAINLSFAKKLFLSAMAVLALATPVIFGPLHATASRADYHPQNAATSGPVYETALVKIDEAGTASLKTGGGVISQRLRITAGTFAAKNASLRDLIRLAYGVEDYQILGFPNSLNSDLYDVDAKAQKSVVNEMQRLNNDQRQLQNSHMLQALLEDRFQLKAHLETRNLPAFSLVVVEPGRITEAQGDCGPHSNLPTTTIWKPGMPAPPPPCGTLRAFLWQGGLGGRKAPIKELVANLSVITGRLVQDKTNLTGKYDIDLTWLPDPGELPAEPAGALKNFPPSVKPDPNRAPLLTAIEQQLGLRLEPQTALVEVLVIDHVEQISDTGLSELPSQVTPAFAAASIKINETGNDKQSSILFPPSGFTATNVSLQVLIRAAYGVEDDRISGAPSWLNSVYYDVDARVDSSGADEVRKPSEDQLKFERLRLLQALLADRFRLTVHREAKVLPIYALVIAENRPKLQEAKPGDTYANGLQLDGLPAGPHFMDLRRGGQFKAQAEPVAVLARVLSRVLGCLVLDKTGLAGDYDFNLKWIPDESLAPHYKGTNLSESSGPSIFAALQEQLGLKLVTQQGPVELLVIDRAEKPSEN